MWGAGFSREAVGQSGLLLNASGEQLPGFAAKTASHPVPLAVEWDGGGTWMITHIYFSVLNCCESFADPADQLRGLKGNSSVTFPMTLLGGRPH
jgi:hypothetical protein